MNIPRRTAVLPLLSVAVLFAVPITPLRAAVTDVVPDGSVSISQKSDSGQLSAWQLVSTSQTTFSGSGAAQGLSIPSGTYTFFIVQPQGLRTEIRLLSGSTLLQTVEHPQVTFTTNNNTHLTLDVRFYAGDTGNVSVASDPQGVAFQLTGPNGIALGGATPDSFDGLQLGLYSIRYILPESCPPVPAKSSQLELHGRVDFSISIHCASLKAPLDPSKDATKFVSVPVNGKPVVLFDVPLSAWFSTYVYEVAKRGIIVGYRGTDGAPSGQFGPENPVTLAELAKIALAVAGLNADPAVSKIAHSSAAGWNIPYIAAAESRDWLAYLDPLVDVNRPATRGEVLATLLQALDIPLRWPKGTLFSDVTRRTLYASAIETAARDGIVSGTTASGVTMLPAFGPSASINRAEFSKIITLAMEKYRLDPGASK